MTRFVPRSALLRQLLVVGAGQIAAALLGVIGLRVFTELAPPEVFGEANLILGVLSLGLSVMVFPLTESQLRLYPQHRRNGTEARLVRLVLGLSLLSALGLCLIVVAWLQSGIIHQPTDHPLLLGAILCAHVLAVAFRNVALNLENSERRQGRYAVWQVADASLLVGSGSLLLLVHPGPASLLAANLCAVAMGSTVLLSGPKGLLRTVAEGHSGSVPVRGILRDLGSFGWPYVIFALLGWLMGLFDRFALASFLDAAVVGQYVAVASIASRLMLMPAQVFALVFRPILYDAAARGQTAVWRRTASVWLGLTSAGALVLLLGMHLLSEAILELLLAAEYREGGRTVLLLVGFSFGLLTAAQVVEQLILSYRQSSTLLLSRCMGAAAAVGASLVSIPALGAEGAALGSASGHLVLLATSILLVWRPTAKAAPPGAVPVVRPADR